MREARRVRREAGGRREDEGGRREQGGGRRKEAGASGAANAGCTDARGADAPACAREHPCRRGVGGISWRFVSRRLSVRPGWHLRMLGMPEYGDGVILVVMSSVGLLVLACAGHHMRSADGDNSRSNRGGSQQVPPLRAELRSTSSLCFSSTYACIKEMELGVWFAAPTPLGLIRGRSFRSAQRTTTGFYLSKRYILGSGTGILPWLGRAGTGTAFMERGKGRRWRGKVIYCDATIAGRPCRIPFCQTPKTAWGIPSRFQRDE